MLAALLLLGASLPQAELAAAQAASPTPLPTSTSAPTHTPAATATAILTATPLPPSATSTSAPTGSPTGQTASPSPGGSSTSTPAATASTQASGTPASATATPATPAATAAAGSATPGPGSITPTATIVRTPATSTATLTATLTPTATVTASSTPSPTATCPPAGTTSATATATPTATPTPARTATSTVAISTQACPTPTPGVAIGGNVSPLVARARLVGHADPAMTLHVSFVLAPRSLADLQSRARQFRGNRQRLTHADYVRNHAPLQTDYDKLRAYLSTATGVKIVKTSDERSHIYIEAALADVETLLGTTINTYDLNGRQFFANATEPRLPDGLSQLVASIGGLQNGLVFRPRSLSSPGATPYTPAEIQTAYDIAPLVSRGYDGTGQTIGIVTLAPFDTNDVRHFESLFGLPQASITTVASSDPPTPLCGTGGGDASTADVEWASAMAPKAAIKAFVGSDNCDFIGPLQLAVADSSVSVIAVSWGACEGNFTSADRSTIDSLLVQAMGDQKSVLVASGDSGSNDCGAGTVDFPASDPNVTAVGGTTLTLKTDGTNTRLTETGWTGSGGGCSSVYTSVPSWQSIPSDPCSGRAVPDVAANADSSTPYTTYYNGSQGSAHGTSLATAVWAGLLADVNRGRAANVSAPQGAEGFANTDIYDAPVAATFYDVTSGSNGFGAGSGWDRVTGWGSPDGNALAAQLGVLTRPGAPTAVSATPGDGQAAVSWTAPSTNGGVALTQYRVTATASNNSTSTQTVSGAPPAATLVFSGLTNGTSYTFTVAASNDAGPSYTYGPESAASLSATPNTGSPNYLPNITVASFVTGLTNPAGVAVGPVSGDIYVADVNSNSIKVIHSGTLSTLAGGTQGFADGTSGGAQFHNPWGVAVDGSTGHDVVYVADTGNHAIRKIDTSLSTSNSSYVTTFAGATSAQGGGSGLAGSSDGSGNSARFSTPKGIATDGSGNLYVGDTGNNRIRKIVISSAAVSTVAGQATQGFADGAATTTALFNSPVGVAYNASNSTLYIADQGNNRIRRLIGGTVDSWGSGAGFFEGTTATVQFNQPIGVAVDGSGNVYVSDAANYRIRQIASGGGVSTAAGDGNPGTVNGSASASEVNLPFGIALSGSTLYVAGFGDNTVRTVSFGSTVPSPPLNVSATPGNGQVTVSWTAPPDGGSTILDYTVSWSGAGSGSSGAVAGTSYTATGLTNFGAYSFTVTARNANGSSTAASASPGTVYPAPVVISGHFLAGTTVKTGIQSAQFACTSSSSAACTAGLVAAPGDGSFQFSTNPGKYDLYLAASDQNTSGFNSTSPTYVDATSGSAFSADIQVSASSVALSGTVTTATYPAGTLKIGIPSSVFPGSYDYGNSTVAASTGSYALSIAPGTYTLLASAPGYAQSAPRQVAFASTPASQNFSLTAAAVTINGYVHNGASPVQGLPLSFECVSTDPAASCESASFSGVTAADGSFSLYANKGKYDIFVKPGANGGYNSLAATSLDASNPGGSTINLGTPLQVSPASTLLSGRVLDASNAGISGATVNIGFASNLVDSGYDYRGVSTQSDGSYSLFVAPGTYAMNAGASGFLTSSSASVVASGGATSHDFTLATAGLTVTGFVRDGSSNPIAGATLSYACSATSAATCDTAGFLGQTAADGSFTFSANHGRYDLWVGPGGGNGYNSTAATFVDLSGSAPGSVTVTVAAATGGLAGTVTNASNSQPIAGAAVSIGIPSTLLSGSYDFVRILTDSNGAYAVALAPGTYTVTASASGFAAAAYTSPSVTASSTTTANFSLSTAPVTISGQLLSGLTPIAHAALTFDCDSTGHPSCANSSFAGSTDANGNFTLNAYAGRYDLYVRPGSPSGFNSTSPTVVDATSGSVFTGVVVHASPASTTLSGTVHDTGNTGVSGAVVNLGLLSTFAIAGYDFRAILADTSGHYSVALAPGTYGVYASDPTNTLAASTTIPLGIAGSALTQNFTLGAVTATWTGAGTAGNWSDYNNWSPATVPGSGSAVVIPQVGSNNYPTLASSVTVDSLTVQPSGLITITSSGVDVALTVNSGAANLGGSIVLQHTGGGASGSAKLVVSGGTLANSGSLSIGGDTAATSVISGSISNNGPLAVSAPLHVQLGSGKTFTNAGDLAIGSGASLLVDGGGTFTHSGTLEVNGSGTTATVSGTTFTNFANRALTGGTYALQGTLKVDNAYVTQLAAALTLDGTASAIKDQGNSDALTPLNSILAGASLSLANSRSFTSSGTFGNSGTLTIGANSTFTTGSNATAGLSGSPRFSQTSSGSLAVSLTGSSVYSQLTGSSGVGASLAGTLSVDAGGTGFVPSSGTFGIISFPGGVSGTFSTVHNAGTGQFAALVFTPAYTSTAVSLALTPNIVSVVLSTSNTSFGNCTGGNGPQGGALMGYPNATCSSGTVTVTVNGTASSVTVQATDAQPSGSGPLWTLCGADTSCSGANPGADQLRLSAVDNGNSSNSTILGHTAQCDAAFGCGPISNSSHTEYLRAVGPDSSNTQSATYSTTVTWTASS